MKTTARILSLSVFTFVGCIILISLLPSCGTMFDDSNGINQEVTEPHKCNWKGCDYGGLNQLPAPYNPIDSIHFVHPEFDYERCEVIEDSLFNLKK